MNIQRALYTRIYKPFLQLYLRRDTTARFDGFRLRVLKGVFHPKLFFSTPYFYSFLKRQDLAGKKFLEIGSGSGLLSLLAYRKKALVTCIDVDETAVENTRLNFALNFNTSEGLQVLHSDLFSRLPSQVFDLVVINPPYFFRAPALPGQQAWYCGENGEYFERLFAGLGGYLHEGSRTFMILADICDIERIQAMAGKSGISFALADERRIRWEKNFIFELKLNDITCTQKEQASLKMTS